MPSVFFALSRNTDFFFLQQSNGFSVSTYLPLFLPGTWVWINSGSLVMDREAWRAEIHGVVKSRTWLSNWTELKRISIIYTLLKILMLGKIEGKRRRGQQRRRCLDSITDSMDMNLSKFQETVKDRGAWHATVTKNWTWLSDWTTKEYKENYLWLF